MIGIVVSPTLAPVLLPVLALLLLATKSNLMLLALATASTKPRNTRTSHLLFAILAFVTYYNFINVGQNWIASGRVGFFDTVLMLHGGVFLVIWAWLIRRQYRP